MAISRLPAEDHARARYIRRPAQGPGVEWSGEVIAPMCQPHYLGAQPSNKERGMVEMMQLTEEQWRERLTPEQYAVLRGKGTERAFTGAYWDTKTPGLYKCAACDLELFRSDTKYDSGSGWPSFTEPITSDAVRYETDKSYGMQRVEVLCGRCGSHLGHVFPDGPAPSGQRFCMNSISLELEPEA